MGRNDAPGALHRNLHDKGADGEHEGRRRIGPERNRRQRDEAGDRNRVHAADLFGDMAEEQSADDRADIGDDADQAHGPMLESALGLQEPRIEVLRAVAEEIEAHHERDGIKGDAPIGLERFEEAEPRTFLRFDEGRRFRHVRTDDQNGEGGQDAQEEHAAPVDRVAADLTMVQQYIGDRSKQITHRIAALENAGNQAARLRRNRFHGERAAETPFATHGDAKERAQNEENDEIGREGGERADDRVTNDVDHQRGLAADSIADPPENEGANKTGREGEEQRPRDFERDAEYFDGAKFFGDVAQLEDQNKEIEGVESPTKERGEHRFLLRSRQIHPRSPKALMARRARNSGVAANWPRERRSIKEIVVT